MRYAIATGRAQRNPCADLRDALKPAPERHHAAITEPDALGPLLRAIEGYQGTHVARRAMRLAPLVFLRPVELRPAELAHVATQAPPWNLHAAQLNLRQPHVFPLTHPQLPNL